MRKEQIGAITTYYATSKILHVALQQQSYMTSNAMLLYKQNFAILVN
jgi:hypothetical protein